ncbi:MAG TPA: PIG-L family deacetylase [Candidatus Limiplasma sp.]|nr:PIG-L family deacetylase [Candidatus Limiplasma sp.]
MMKAGFFSIRYQTFSEDIRIIFPHWDQDTESVVVLSPHDDDALLGVGYMITHLVENHVPVKIVIFCKGDTGYSSPELRDSIVEIRKAETLNAYSRLGLSSDDIIFLDIPDFSLRKRVGWDGLGTDDAIFGKMIRLLRKHRVTRLMVANGHREHSDHTAVHDIGMFDGVQAGDPILSDYGELARLRSTHIYSVWADFSPDDALECERPLSLRANMGMAVDEAVEKKIIDALQCYVSQMDIIDGLVRMREEKRSDKGFIELYQWVDPRPRLSYAPYVAWLNALEGQ